MQIEEGGMVHGKAKVVMQGRLDKAEQTSTEEPTTEQQDDRQRMQIFSLKPVELKSLRRFGSRLVIF